jgi:diguanylate cyclase (GGDEF)-like protein
MFAQVDPVSQLPNMRMAYLKLEETLQHAEESGEQFAILLFYCDDLRQYNMISLEAGDEALRLLVSIYKTQLRESDFLARWRTMDEFIFILPSTSKSEAQKIGIRICVTVEQASLSWKFHTTISGGIALYPDHGRTVHDLIDSAEVAISKGKRR